MTKHAWEWDVDISTGQCQLFPIHWAAMDMGSTDGPSSVTTYNQVLLPGSLSLIADLRRPFASSDEYGDRTLSPGQLLYHAAKHCECCAATPTDAPFGPRNTIGT